MTRSGANPRLRIYRYAPGQRPASTGTPWSGSTAVTAACSRSCSTSTTTSTAARPTSRTRRTITPRTGSALLFQHRMLHTASEVLRGEKLVLRTDVLYRPPR